MKNKVIKISPPQFLLLIFLLFIVFGTILLKIPAATHGSISWLDSLFTATSAMTVTGLVVVDTGTAFTIFGQMVILFLIQVGGIGIMTFAVFIFLVLGRKIGLKERLLVGNSLNQTSLGGLIRLVKRILLYSLIIEGIAFIFLTLRWGPMLGWRDAIYAAFFHSISAFNNAGFSIWSDSLSGYVGDPVINIIITLLFIIGGLGFTVLFDLWRTKEFHQLSLHSKLMIKSTIIINLLTMILFFVLEYSNPDTIGSLSLGEKLWASYFQAVTPRTAGFNTLDIGSLQDPTLFFTIFLMFIGAGSASTGGGIKVTTFLAITLAATAYMRGKEDIDISERALSQGTVFRSLAISILSVGIIFLGLFILTISEYGESFIALFFEVVSAFGTVGLSMGITASLSAIGKLVIICIMFIGKLGPLTLAFSIAAPTTKLIRYPKEEILTG
ncbi:TrkH family potassium uptake protein [Bacillaceae bacterium S4-13-56]